MNDENWAGRGFTAPGPEEEPAIEEYDPDAGVDDQGGMSEHRCRIEPEAEW